MAKQKKLITLKEYAERCGKSVSQIGKLCAQGRIEGALKAGRCWYVPENTPDKLLDLREASSASLVFYTLPCGKPGSLGPDELKAKQKVAEASVLFKNLGYTQTAENLLALLEGEWN